MAIRPPAVAGAFYEGAASTCRALVERYARDYTPPDDLGDLWGGVVPHAGWVYSGPTAAKVFVALQAAKPQTFLLFGAVHRPVQRTPAAYPEGAWETPLGQVEIDAEVLHALQGAGIDVNARAHAGEHSIEVQVPFIQALHPQARIVPVAVPHDPGAAEAGKRMGAAIKSLDRRIVVVASTDLTHYGMGYFGQHHGRLPEAMSWMRENDGRMIALIENLDAESVVAEASEHENACGAGAVAAAMAVARELGARRGRRLEYTTSAEATGDTHADRAVGYLGAVFEG